MAFTLHPQLAQDTLTVGDLALSRVLLMNNKLFPWIILVPCVEKAREIIDLDISQQHQLMDEIAAASRAMQALFSPDKLNVAALGNQVPQLHVHVIARFTVDAAWPHPVWGKGSEPYSNPQAIVEQFKAKLRKPLTGQRGKPIRRGLAGFKAR